MLVQWLGTCVINGTSILSDQSTGRSVSWVVPSSDAPVSRLFDRYLLRSTYSTQTVTQKNVESRVIYVVALIPPCWNIVTLNFSQLEFLQLSSGT